MNIPLFFYFNNMKEILGPGAQEIKIDVMHQCFSVCGIFLKRPSKMSSRELKKALERYPPSLCLSSSKRAQARV